MTIPNGSRITESIDGIVQGANERGVHLQGEDDWRTFSKWAIKPEGAPARGQRVRLGLDGSGFVRELQVLDDTGAAVAPAPAAAQDRTTVRLRVLEIAAATVGQFAQAREEVRTEHILPLADRLLAWVEQP
jgi:hypothetical protein